MNAFYRLAFSVTVVLLIAVNGYLAREVDKNTSMVNALSSTLTEAQSKSTSTVNALSSTLTEVLSKNTSGHTAINSKINRLSSSVATLSFEVSKISPAVIGHNHASVRDFMISTQAHQIAENGVLLIGDSITEGLVLPQVCGLPVINAGIGGAGVSAFVTRVNKMISITKPRIVVVALGVNDAHGDPNFVDSIVSEWIKIYSEIVHLIKARQAEPVLMTILPVEDGKALGKGYFNSSQILMMNKKIIELAEKNNVVAIDSFANLASDDGLAYSGATIDGVHLTRSSYDVWKNDIRKGVKLVLERVGSDCHGD